MAVRLFGTNGVRGIFGKGLDLPMVHNITRSFAKYVGRGPLIVGHDGRHSSPVISRVACATLAAHGIDHAACGLVPTPCLEFATKRLGYAGGLMVTASHNPPEYNGIKPCGPDGVEISREDERKIEQIYFGKEWDGYPAAYGRTVAMDVVPAYVSGILARIEQDAIRTKRLRVAVDFGNGAQAVAVPEVCRLLDCDVILVNAEVDGSFPGRGPEPTPENLGALSKAVVDGGADLGVAFDGDGDRSVFCDERGNIMPGDMSALLLTRHLLQNRTGTIVTCVNSGNAINRIADDVVRTKVGSVEVSREMIRTGALIGFEENGGFMYGPHNMVRDGAMTLGLVFDLLAGTDTSVFEELSTLPRSHTGKTKVMCRSGVDRLLAELYREHPDADRTDGIRIELDGGWVMVRPSGTEPLVRIYAESDSEAGLRALLAEYEGRVREAVS